MIERDLLADIAHSEPLAQLEAARAAVAPSPRVWHALLLPVARTEGVRFVLTGHINCHDCALCAICGDFRDVGTLVPWRARYGDCTDDAAEGDDFFDAYRDAVTNEPLAHWAAEALRACYYTGGGDVHATGFALSPEMRDALDVYLGTRAEVAASRLSGAYMLVDALFSEQPRTPVPNALSLPAPEVLAAPVTATSCCNDA